MEQSEARQALWDAAGLRHRQRRADLKSERDGRVGVWGYSLREAFPEPPDACAYLRERWERGMGHALILEAGSRASAEWLQTVRDGLHLGTPQIPIEAPCRSKGRCPRGSMGGDWCHFTWNVGLGPRAQQLLQRCGRDGQRLHGSFLRLGGRDVGAGDRVLDVRPKGKVTWIQVCTREGEQSWEFQKRDRALFRLVNGLVPGQRVVLTGSSTEKGSRIRWGPDSALAVDLPVDDL